MLGCAGLKKDTESQSFMVEFWAYRLITLCAGFSSNLRTVVPLLGITLSSPLKALGLECLDHFAWPRVPYALYLASNVTSLSQLLTLWRYSDLGKFTRVGE